MMRIRDMTPDDVPVPRNLVDKSTPVRSVLHPLFTWDDDKASDLWRLSEAGKLTRSVFEIRELPSGEKRAVRSYQLLRGGEVRKGKAVTYCTLDEMLADESQRSQVIADAMRQLVWVANRYRTLNEFSVVFREIDKLADSFSEP